ncbi:MAG: phosphomethylpyrimidine synthase ThiC [Halobacteriota archaeon]|nr:phosphomethylpyrimidine synthase ThiC [Halobacteriota archaeon]
MTLLGEIKRGVKIEELSKVAENERIPDDTFYRRIASGKIVVMKHTGDYVAIGKGLRTKVNCSIGSSPDLVDIDMEVKKAITGVKSGADSLMELSTGGDLDQIRRRVLDAVDVPVGSVPLYQAAIDSIRKDGSIFHMTEDDIFNSVERHAKDGIRFMAIHCGINKLTYDRVMNQGRYGGIVSRGGAFLLSWIDFNETENPLFANFDYLLEILKEHEVVLSLGNGMRAGCVHDSLDRAQTMELIINCELADRANEAGVQAIVEGPGHIPINEIEAFVKLQKRLSNEKPFYVLGPITTDVAPGYDHITSAIGSAIGSSVGVDFICYVTPAEHLALPYPEDVKEGVMASRIAAHIGDMIKYDRKDQDLGMAKARREVNWEGQFRFCLDPKRAKEIKNSRPSEFEDTCAMCGEYCALKILKSKVKFLG